MAGRITVIGAFLFAILFSQIEKANGLPSGPSTDTFKTSSVLRVAVVGDTGIGKRAYHPGFLAVQKAMRDMLPEVLYIWAILSISPNFFLTGVSRNTSGKSRKRWLLRIHSAYSSRATTIYLRTKVNPKPQAAGT